MKVLIQDEQTGLYLAHQDQWTDSLPEARDFAFSIHATAVAKNIRLQKFQIFFYFPDLNYKISVYGGQDKVAA